MNKETFKIRFYAHRYWDLEELPPVAYRALVVKYITDHPDEFKGADPQ